MKAIRKSDGKQIEVEEWRGTSDVAYYTLNMNEFYQESDLDFLPEKETAVLEGWVARDEDGLIHLFDTEPERIADCAWATYPGHSLGVRLPENSFPSVTWQSEPKEIRMTLELIDE